MRPGPAALLAAAALLADAARADADDTTSPRSGSTATLLALGGTVGSLALSAYGGGSDNPALMVTGIGAAMIAPSFGHIYAGLGSHAMVTSAIRIAGAATMVVAIETSLCVFCSDDERERKERQISGMLAFAGFGTYVAATAYDLLDARYAARRANRRAAVAVPTVLTSPDGQRAPGLVIGGSF